MKRVLIKSADGSNTLKLEEFDESYHSMNGALSESNYIYIGCGLSYYCADRTREINIFEVGLGTGLNCLLSAMFAIKNKGVRINYTSIEKYPVTDEEYLALDHLKTVVSQSEGEDSTDIRAIKYVYDSIQFSGWGEKVDILPEFSLLKVNSDLLTYREEDELYDIVYFDAFSPNTQPELWSIEVFKSMYKAMKHGGILVTYSSKGIVKQALREAGFEISRLPGPKGKRHIIRATKRSLA